MVARDLPKFSPLFKLFGIAALLTLVLVNIFDFITGSIEFISNRDETESLGDAIEIQLILAQGRFLPWACLFLLLKCVVKSPNIVWRICWFAATVFLLVSIIQIALNFGIHLVQAGSTSILLFVARFAALTLYVYFSFLTLAVFRMKKISKKTWKVFDIGMLLLALFAFAGTVLQKAAGESEIISALAVISATIAFALKFSKMTCEFNAE